MHAKSPQDQDRVPVVQEKKDGNNGLFEILKSSEKQIHRSPDVWCDDISRAELKGKRPLFGRPVTSRSTPSVRTISISEFVLWKSELDPCMLSIYFPSDLGESLVLFPNNLEFSGNILASSFFIKDAVSLERPRSSSNRLNNKQRMYGCY